MDILFSKYVFSNAFLKINNIHEIESVDDYLFKSLFWLDKETFFKVYARLLRENQKLILKEMFVFFHFLKEYKSYIALGEVFNLDGKTISNYVDTVISTFNQLLENFKWDPNERFNESPLIVNGTEIYSVIDTSFYRIEKPTIGGPSFAEYYYSPNHKCYGIKIQSAVNVSNGMIHWVSSNYAEGGLVDTEISEQSGIMNNEEFPLEHNEKILADSIYNDSKYEDVFITPSKFSPKTLTKIKNTLNNRKSSYKTILENHLARQNCSLGILNKPFRGDIDDFGDILQIIYYISFSKYPLKRKLTNE